MPDSAQQLFVPIKATRIADVASICIARLPEGARTALAFTSIDRLTGAMGGQQPWAVMCEDALRTTLAPIGIARIQVDADYVGPAIGRLPRPTVPEPADTPTAYPLIWRSRAHAVA